MLAIYYGGCVLDLRGLRGKSCLKLRVGVLSGWYSAQLRNLGCAEARRRNILGDNGLGESCAGAGRDKKHEELRSATWFAWVARPWEVVAEVETSGVAMGLKVLSKCAILPECSF